MEHKTKPTTHKAQYYETDQMGIIHHSNYIRWFEEARVDFLDNIGWGYNEMEQCGIISPVLNVSCEFKSMVRFGDAVYIIPTLESFTGVKMAVSYKIIDAKTKELKATGKSSHCFLNAKGKPISLKRDFPDIFSALQGQLGISQGMPL